jgi:hypothetical protein
MCIPKAGDEDALDHALHDIADDDRRDQHGRVHRFERGAVRLEAVRPRPPPEWRMDEVDAVVEHLAPFRRRPGASRELPVDGVEHHEDEAGEDAEPIGAVPEEEEGEHAQKGADRGDRVRSHAGLGRPARQVESGLAPQIQRQRVGHALVRGVVGRALDRLDIVRVERKHERPLALAKLVVADLGALRVDELEAAQRAAGTEHRLLRQRPNRRRPGHGRGPARRRGQNARRPLRDHLQPCRVPREGHVGEDRPAAR